MYSGNLRNPFHPDETHFRYAERRKAYQERLQSGMQEAVRPADPEPAEENRQNIPAEENTPPEAREVQEKDSFFGRLQKKAPANFAEFLDQLSPEDAALIALILFFLSDNSDHDVILIGILLYLLLSK